MSDVNNSDSDSQTEINFEITDYDNNETKKKQYIVSKEIFADGPKVIEIAETSSSIKPYDSKKFGIQKNFHYNNSTKRFDRNHVNEKRLICYSIIHREDCTYGKNCTYAHSLLEQIIDPERLQICQLILDKNLMNFTPVNNYRTDDIYKKLLFMSQYCEYCTHERCTGGFNCRNGVCIYPLKLCKNDLLTGECLNKQVSIEVPDYVFDKVKLDGFIKNDNYVGCINGHHLTSRGLIPYYKYEHIKESVGKNKYQSVRYIDINPLNKIFNQKYQNRESEWDRSSDSSTTDEEINDWFGNVNTDSDF